MDLQPEQIETPFFKHPIAPHMATNFAFVVGSGSAALGNIV
jgi:hypothetical protein